MPFERGERLLNFEIKKRLGEGGFGCAYLVRDLDLARDVVIKELLSKHLMDEDMRLRFVREAQTMANLTHPNIVPVYQFIKPEYIPGIRDYYIVMEYLDGGSLAQRLEKQENLPVDQAISITIDVCRGLQQAHNRGIVHRDIKPENILLSKDGKTVKVSDWGIVHLPDSTMTIDGQPGTLFYMSVEQAKANIMERRQQTGITLDGRSDLYSVGAMLFKMVTGRYYLDFHHIIAESRRKLGPKVGGLGLQWAVQKAICQAIIEQQPYRPTRYNPDLLPALEAIILKALAKNPQDRFPSVKEMIEALQRLKLSEHDVSITLSKTSRVNKLFKEARSAIQKRKHEDALKLLKEARAIAPDDSRVYNEMAELYNRMRQHHKARQVLEEGLKLNPHDPVLLKNLGLAYHKSGENEKAIRALEQSLQYDPRQSKIRGLVAQLRHSQAKNR